MAIEAMRGCGFRKVGGLYLCGSGQGMSCDRLPYELEICPTCGGGVKFTRGWTWLDWCMFAGNHHGQQTEHLISAKVVCRCPDPCPACWPLVQPQPYGLLWVGEQFYTPQSFIQEALSMGVSRRISAVPKKLKLGETWVLFAHKKAKDYTTISFGVTGDVGTLPDVGNGGETEEPEETQVSAVFYAFRPQTLELLVWESAATPEHIEDLAKRGITAVIIPNDDIDHHPDTKTKMTDSDRSIVEQANKIAAIRARIRR